MAAMEMEKENIDGGWEHSNVIGQDPEKLHAIDPRTSIIQDEEVVNASGHRDQLKRHYGLLSICGLALTIDNAWVALGGSIAVSISWSSRVVQNAQVLIEFVDNGGPAGVLYELLVACFYYGFLAASIAEVCPSTTLLPTVAHISTFSSSPLPFPPPAASTTGPL